MPLALVEFDAGREVGLVFACYSGEWLNQWIHRKLSLGVLVPWNLGLMSLILTEIIESWYPLPHTSINHDAIWDSASILKWSRRQKVKVPSKQQNALSVTLQGASTSYQVRLTWTMREGPWLGGKLTERSTRYFFISSLGEFVYLDNLDLNGWVVTTYPSH